jgi:hypothetical protein
VQLALKFKWRRPLRVGAGRSLRGRIAVSMMIIGGALIEIAMGGRFPARSY